MLILSPSCHMALFRLHRAEWEYKYMAVRKYRNMKYIPLELLSLQICISGQTQLLLQQRRLVGLQTSQLPHLQKHAVKGLGLHVRTVPASKAMRTGA